MYLVILLYALFASLFGLAKNTLNYSEPFFLIGSRMFFAGLIMFFYQLIKHPDKLKLDKKKLYLLVLLGFFNIYLTNICEIWGLQHMVSAKACLIYSLSPFISALFSYFLFSETLSYRKYLGLSFGVLGLLPCFMDSILAYKQSSQISLGEIVLLIAVISSVFGWILLKKLVSDCKFSPISASAYSMLLGGFIGLFHSFLAGESWNPIPVNNFALFSVNTLLMCLISNIICYNLYGYLLKSYTVTFMSFAGLVTPLFASLFGWFFLQELISPEFFLSLFLFAIGLYFFHQEEIKSKGFQVRNLAQQTQ